MSVRNREMIFICEKDDVPVVREDGLSYDTCREFLHDGYQRGAITIMSPNAPMNGAAGRNAKNKITHKVRVFKHDQIEVDKVVIWMDGIMARLLKIDSVQQDPESRRHLYLYCVEYQYSTDVTEFSGISAYGANMNSNI